MRSSLACRTNTPVAQTEPPEAPWHSVSADVCGPLPTGDYLLVIVEDYTRYPVVGSTSAITVILVMDTVSSMFGIPRVVKTDNGPTFNSDQFSQFADHLGFHHRRITPLWPQANATAEIFMCTQGKAIRVAETQGTPWRQRLNIFLRDDRSTHITASPSLGRSLCCKEHG